MHTLIVCGTPWCKTAPLFEQLVAAGISRPEPPRNGGVSSPWEWHERLFASRRDILRSVVQPGKAWEMAAGAMFLANWEQLAWGWEDHRSTWLLDFWREFDPSTRFVLVQTPAAEALATAAAQGGETAFNTASALDTWCAYESELLRFYNRNRDRCVWVRAHMIGQAAAVDAVNEAFGLKLQFADGDWATSPDEEEASTSSTQGKDAAANPDALVRALIDEVVRNHPQALALESELRATLPFAGEAHLDGRVAQFDAAWISDQLRLVVKAKIELEGALAIANEAREELSAQTAVLQQQAHAAAKTIETLQAEKTQLATARDAKAKAKAEALAARDAQAKLADEHKAALEAIAGVTKEQSQQIAAMEQEKAKLIEALENAARQMRSSEENLKQENELLMLQLHQVQEELEHYFLQHQKVTEDKQQLESRWSKLMERYPDFCEWDEIEAVEGDNRWRIRGLRVGGKQVPVLDLALDVGRHKAALIVRPPEVGGQGLIYWSTCAAAGAASALRVEPFATPPSDEGQLLRRLAPADLQLLEGACGAMEEWLLLHQQGGEAAAKHFAGLRDQLKALPPTWRFDSVQLAHEQVNPDYEHLWFNVRNATYGPRRWPNFEFRLSASNVRRGKFSTHPKLEFPLPDEGAKQFENWFEESEDDRGPKFELRFETKGPAMDVATWNVLSETDRAQAISLVARLPAVLEQLQQSGTNVRRPWKDWQRLATGIQDALKTCLKLPKDAFILG